jgi:hypothetical protein
MIYLFNLALVNALNTFSVPYSPFTHYQPETLIVNPERYKQTIIPGVITAGIMVSHCQKTQKNQLK